MDTIHALATAEGRAGVAVIRISGPSADLILGRLTAKPLPEVRRMVLRTVLDIAGGVLDRPLVVRFPASGSFTGEPVVELHLHGSRAVVRAVLRRLDEIGESRLAEAGEFTRRALFNERLDLTQVQGLGDLIEADTELQRQAAMRVFDGELGRLVGSWRRDLVEAAAYLEATIDFADEDVPVDVTGPVRDRLERVASSMRRQLANVGALRAMKTGYEVAIIGLPNAGKSSLLNAIARRDVAIVSEIAGTTRDVLEVPTDLGGLPVVFLDTAGLRHSDDPIERIGVEKARRRAEGAALRILLVDSVDRDLDAMGSVRPDLCVRTKGDLNGGLAISSETGEGLSCFLDQVRVRLVAEGGAEGLVHAIRDERDISAAVDLIDAVLADLDGLPEILSERLHSAIFRLSSMLGAVDIEDILDHIFSSFCIGK